MNLEAAYHGLGDGSDTKYQELRAKAKAELIDWATPFLMNGDLYVESIIEEAITRSEDMGRVSGEYFLIEIPGRFTSSREPLTF